MRSWLDGGDWGAGGLGVACLGGGYFVLGSLSDVGFCVFSLLLFCCFFGIGILLWFF